MTEFGNIDLVEKRESNEGGNVKIRLPGVVKGDMAARSFKPEVRVFSISFSPTGESRKNKIFFKCNYCYV